MFLDLEIKDLEASLRGFSRVKLWRKEGYQKRFVCFPQHFLFCLEGPTMVDIATFVPSNELFSFKFLNSSFM